MTDEHRLIEESRIKKHSGLIQLYTGNGKGKTTSSVGLVTRALSYDWKVLVVQFLKTNCHAYSFLEKMSDKITVKQFGRPKITLPTNADQTDREIVGEAWNFIHTEFEKNEYDMIVLDEVLPALNMFLFLKTELYDFMKQCRERKTELVLTGRMWSSELKAKIVARADLVSDVTVVKHYFSKSCSNCNRSFEDYSYTNCPYCGTELKSVPARQGIEW